VAVSVVVASVSLMGIVAVVVMMTAVSMSVVMAAVRVRMFFQQPKVNTLCPVNNQQVLKEGGNARQKAYLEIQSGAYPRACRGKAL